jgi:hydroxymethylpyrimidine pyrophosphatase-like HAD family hydrolase
MNPSTLSNFKNRKIIAIDFDGTLVKDAYPSIGKPMPFAFDTLKKLQAEGHLLILWTYRSGKALDEAVEFSRKQGIEYYAVNKNNPEEEFEFRSSRLGGSQPEKKSKSTLPNKKLKDSNLDPKDKINSKLDSILDKIENDDVDVLMTGIEKKVKSPYDLVKLGIQLVTRANQTNRPKLVSAIKTLFNINI